MDWIDICQNLSSELEREEDQDPKICVLSMVKDDRIYKTSASGSIDLDMDGVHVHEVQM